MGGGGGEATKKLRLRYGWGVSGCISASKAILFRAFSKYWYNMEHAKSLQKKASDNIVFSVYSIVAYIRRRMSTC